MNQKYKIENYNIVWPIIAILITLFFSGVLFYNIYFQFTEPVQVGEFIFIFCFLTLIIYLLAYITQMGVYTKQFERYIEFKIIAYDYWDNKTQSYLTKYIVNGKGIHTKFIFYKHIKTYTLDSIDNLTEYIQKQHTQYAHLQFDYPGYDTKEHAMEYITDYIKSLISDNIKENDIDIRLERVVGTINFL